MSVQGSQQINIHQLLEKFKSKKEFYRFLQLDCKAFLPKIGATNVYYFKQILQGKKKIDKVKVSSVPHIEGLTVQDFLNYARQNPNILRYLPDERDWVHLDRQWISDMLYTLDTDHFQSYINEAIKKRQEKLENQQSLTIQMRPEFAEALQECRTFSHDKGRSVFLIKDSSKRKRTREEVEEVKGEEESLKQNKQEFLRQNKRLKIEKQQLEQQVQFLNNNQDLLNQLLENGLINEHGDIIVQNQFQI